MKQQRVVKPRAKRHYVNNKDFYEAMVKYKAECKLAEEAGKSKPRVPRYVGECLMMICNKLSTKPNFMSYSYRDEMIADGIENCLASVDNFDPDKSINPFAYFTQIAWNAFIRRITKEKKQAYIKHKNFENSGIMDELLQSGGEGYSSNMKHNPYSDDIIRNFEDKLTKNTKRVKMGIEKFAEREDAEEQDPHGADSDPGHGEDHIGDEELA
jgi:DNA-directed RNA polymerase specialized sigma24 family protein